MKNVLCYLGIFVLFVLIFVPPVLRFAMEDRKVDDGSNFKPLLVCSSSEYFVSTKYIEGKATDVQFVYLTEIKEESADKEITDEKDNEEASEENKEEKEVDSSTETDSDTEQNTEQDSETPVKKISVDDVKTTNEELDSLFKAYMIDDYVVGQTVDKGYMLTINFSILSPNSDFSPISGTYNTQKSYYERLGLSCS